MLDLFRGRGVWPAGELLVTTTTEDDVIFFELFGELDIANAGRLLDQLTMAAGSGAPDIIVDLSALHFMDSSGMHALVSAQARCQRRGVDISLIRGPRSVQRLFELSGADALFTFIA